MILIIGNHWDTSTNQVIEWLRFWNKPYLRINETDTIQIVSVKYNHPIPNICFRIDQRIYNTDDISYYWFRRGVFNYSWYKWNQNTGDDNLTREINDNLDLEASSIHALFQYILEQKSKIGSLSTADNNKIIHLSQAKAMKLDIPSTIICTSKKELINFYKTNSTGIITKSIHHMLTYRQGTDVFDSSLIYNFTSLVDQNDFNSFPDTFPPTLLQEKIEKKIELRIFYLNGNFYSMAIFSQSHEQTSVDFRRYDRKKENYRVPYSLPADVESKLDMFMQKIGLETGSIDMILGQDNKYYFLEVNPVGQFGMVSYPCNYNLEKIIASQLIENTL